MPDAAPRGAPDDDTVVGGPPPAGPPALPAAAAPRRLGPYDVLRELGRGGMGVVFEAHDPRLGRRVAIKKLLTDVDAASRHRFRREAQLLGQLRHPGIAQVFEVVLEGADAPYLVMEHVAGRPLVDLCRGGPLAARRAASILVAVSDAVAAAHGGGVLHRDLKPHNVMIGADDRPVILDFGLGKALDGRSRGVTESGVVLGTPAYMPPEQVDSARGLDVRADVYALGATLYHALAGRPPFEGASPLNVISGVLNRAPVPPGRHAAGVPRDLETICLRCLEKEPARRYPTAAALAADLRRFLAGAPIEARPVGGVARLARGVWRRKGLVAALTLGLALAAAAGVGLVGRLEVADRELDKVQRASDLLDRLREALRFRSLPLGSAEQERALIAAAHGEIAGIVSALEGLTAEPPRPARVLVIQGWARLGLMDVEGAVACADAALREDPASGAAHLLRGRALTTRVALELHRGELVDHDPERWAAEARASFTRARELGQALDPLDAAWDAIAHDRRDEARRLVAELPPHRAGEEKELVLAALELLPPGDQAAGLRHLDAALTLCPRLPEALMMRSWLWTGRREYAAALTDLDRLVQLAPGSAMALLSRARAREALQDLDGALADYDAALRLKPGYVQALNGRAVARGARGDLDGAMADLQAALRLRPDDRVLLGNRAHARSLRGDLDGALADSERVVELAPDDADGRVRRALLLARIGARGRALADLDVALRLRPDDAETLHHRASVRSDAGDLQGALADFDRSIELQGDPMSYFRRGKVKARRGDLAGALADFEAARRHTPTFVSAIHAAARIEQRLGNLDRALALDDEAVRLRPDLPQIVLGRAGVRAARGDLRGAAEDYEAALRLEPRNEDAAQLRRFIEEHLGRPSRY